MNTAWRPWKAPFSAPDFRLLLDRVVNCRDCTESDARAFFASTAPTRGLTSLLSSVYEGLQGRLDKRVFLVKAGRGWGKTHALSAVFHAAKSGIVPSAPEALHSTLRVASRTKTAVAHLDGSSTGYRDILRDYGLPSSWSLIAVRLAESAGIKLTFSPRGPPPGARELSSLLEAASRRGFRPLIIIDDADRYLDGVESAAQDAGGEEASRLRREAQHFLAFISSLSEAVSSVRHAALLVSVTSGSASAGRVVEALGEHHFATPPVEPDEIGDLLVARLVESINPAAAAPVVKSYRDAYREWEVTVEELEKSYPLHPLLVEALTALVSGSPSHRGAASALSIAWRAVIRASNRGDGRDYVLPGDLDARDPGDLEVILPRGSGGLEGLRAAVQRDTSVLARIDNALEREGLPPLASGIYAHLLLWSAAGKALHEIKVAVGSASPVRGVDLNGALAVVRKLSEEAIHIHEEAIAGGRGYIVKARVNIGVLVRREARRLLEEGTASEHARETLARIVGRLDAPIEVLLWPEGPPKGGWPVKLVILGPSGPSVSEVFESAKPWVNTLVVLKPEERKLEEALNAAASILAIRELLNRGDLTGDDAEEASRLASQVEERFKESLALAYSRAYYPAPHGIGEAMLGVERILHSGLWNAVKDALVRSGKLAYDRVEPLIAERLLSSRGEASVKELIEVFARDPSLPVVLDPSHGVRAALRFLIASGRAALADAEEPCGTDPGELVDEAIVLSCSEAVARGFCIPEGGACRVPEKMYTRKATQHHEDSVKSRARAETSSPVIKRIKSPMSRLAADFAGILKGYTVESLKFALRGSGIQGVAAVRALLEGVNALGARIVEVRVRLEVNSGRTASGVLEIWGSPEGVSEILRGARALGDAALVEALVYAEGINTDADDIVNSLARSPLRVFKALQVEVEARLSPSPSS